MLLLVPATALVLVWGGAGHTTSLSLWGLELTPYASTTLGRLFATVFLLMVFFVNIFALRVARATELAAAQIYAGSAVCIALAGDFLSLFLFWEVSAIASAIIVFSGDTHEARAAAIRYLFMHVLSGVVMLIGIVGMFIETGDLGLRILSTEQWYSCWILVGVLINVGAPPFSAWIADAYPRASASGTVYLSAFTTKTSVYVLLAVFAGTAVLIPLGTFMVFYGIVYALLENNMRRILAYSIVNQVGFMVIGAGIGTSMAINGAATHAFVHIIYKGLLLMSAGSVLFITGRNRCSDLGGLYKHMPFTMVCGAIGGAAISAVPFTSGYIAKPLVLAATLEANMAWLWLLLIAAGAGVFLHAGIKYVWFVFFQKVPLKEWATEPPLSMRIAMGCFAAACIVIGFVPELLYMHLPTAVDYNPNTVKHIVGQTQLLVAAAIAFFVMLPLLRRTETVSLDFDWFYRKPAIVVARCLMDSAHRTNVFLFGVTVAIAKRYHEIEPYVRILPYTRNTVSLLMLILAVLLFVALFSGG